MRSIAGVGKAAVHRSTTAEPKNQDRDQAGDAAQRSESPVWSSGHTFRAT